MAAFYTWLDFTLTYKVLFAISFDGYDIQALGGPGLVVVFQTENMIYDLIFDLMQSAGEINAGASVAVADRIHRGGAVQNEAQVLTGDIERVRGNQGGTQCLLQLDEILGPREFFQLQSRFRLDADDLLAVFQVETVDVQIGDLPDVLRMLPQRWDPQDKVRREQMLVFVIKLIENVGGVHLEGQQQLFAAWRLRHSQRSNRLFMMPSWQSLRRVAVIIMCPSLQIRMRNKEIMITKERQGQTPLLLEGRLSRRRTDLSHWGLEQ